MGFSQGDYWIFLQGGGWGTEEVNWNHCCCCDLPETGKKHSTGELSVLSVPPYLHEEVNTILRRGVVSFVTPWTSLGQQAEGARTRLIYACKVTEAF